MWKAQYRATSLRALLATSCRPPANTADGDAAHIALATAYGMDILLTWNCRHIANAAIVGRLRKFVAKQGYTLPEIYTPEELLGV